MSAPGKIFQAIPKIMGLVGAIAKGRKNQQQGYAFRGIDDVYAALQGHLADNGVFVAPKVTAQQREERKTQKGGDMIRTILTVQFTFFADDGSSFDVVTVGEAMDTADKSSNKSMSAAMKYAMLQVFCIPTEEDNDTENQTPPPSTKKAPVAPKQTGPVPKPQPGQPPAPKAPAPNQGPKLVSEAQIKRLFAILNETDWTKEDLKQVIETEFNKSSTKDLTMAEYDQIINLIQAQGPKGGEINPRNSQ